MVILDIFTYFINLYVANYIKGNFMVKRARTKKGRYKGDKTVISDTRFQNEIKTIMPIN